MDIWMDIWMDGQWFRVCAAFPENRSSVPYVGSVQPPGTPAQDGHTHSKAHIHILQKSNLKK